MADVEATRAVVEEDETYDGKIIPTEQREINRPVRVRPGATVQGSIYGESVTVTESRVDGSVMASDAIELAGGEIDGEVGTPGKVTGNDATVFGTINAKRIRLTDTVVYGNVVGKEVILEDSLVVGIVTTDDTLRLEESVCYTFQSTGAVSIEASSIVLPQAKVEGEIDFETPLAVTGLGELEVLDSSVPTMDNDDLVEVNDGTYLSLAPRILNLEKVTDRLDELERELKQVVTATEREEVPAADDLMGVLTNETA